MKAVSSGSLRRPPAWLAACAVLLAGTLGGCQGPGQALQALAEQRAYLVRPIAAGAFTLMLGTPEHVPHSPRLRLYIEGDGHAWATASQPSLDPTPRTLLVATLAMHDPSPAFYLARPCQFVQSPGCEVALWTNRRFSAQVLDSLDQALTRLKARYGNQDFELVGYSGGAALALLLAARRDDIAQVQTLAGNLSPRLWARQLRLSPLDGSLDPLDVAPRLARVKQRHWIGGADTVVPAALAEAYRAALGPGACVELRTVAHASHDQGLETAWAQGRDTPINCQP